MREKLGCLWFLFCALLGLAWGAFLAWAIYTVVTTYAHSH